MDDEIVLLGAVRTPIGKFLGSLSSLSAPELGARVIREALRRSKIPPEDVDEVVVGNVLTAGLGQAPARQAALKAGLPPSVSALTINMVCGSSLKAVVLAARAIRSKEAEVVVAAGQESMSNAPYVLRGARQGLRWGHVELLDSMVHDGLWDVYHSIPMGTTGEIVAEEFGVTREEADAYSLRSHRLAWEATRSGAFKEEILPVEIEDKGGRRLVEHDEGIRPSTTPEALSRLPPAFPGGSIVTAGNSSQISDGASALVVTTLRKAEEVGARPLARFVGSTISGVEPKRVMAAPIPGIRRLLERAGLGVEEIDLFEHNEAFATASVAVRKALEIPEDRFNVCGGAVALGHPIGASGARVLTTLLYALERRGGKRGVASLCLGGGNAVSVLVERLG